MTTDPTPPSETASPLLLERLDGGVALLRLNRPQATNALSLELDQRMEALGYEVELLDTAEELHELLGALPAHLVLVDAAFSDQLEAIGATVREARERSQQPLLLVALSQADDINLRLTAKRAGVDSLVVEPNGASDVLRRLALLLNPAATRPSACWWSRTTATRRCSPRASCATPAWRPWSCSTRWTCCRPCTSSSPT